MSGYDESTCEQVAFLGETLGPFFLKDPRRNADEIGAAFEAIAALDAQQAADEWPFAERDAAHEALCEMQVGLASDSDEELVWEYRRLFVGPMKKPAPPWGSVYTDRECVVFGESTLALRQWMRERGIQRLGGEAEPEDHIGLMLLLMAWIARHRPELLEEYLRDHLLTWAEHFLEELTQAADQPFYRGLAALANASLSGMRLQLCIDVTYPRFYR